MSEYMSDRMPDKRSEEYIRVGITQSKVICGAMFRTYHLKCVVGSPICVSITYPVMGLHHQSLATTF